MNHPELFKAKATPSTKKIEISDRATREIIVNMNKSVGKSNTTKLKPLQGNGMAAISNTNCANKPVDTNFQWRN